MDDTVLHIIDSINNLIDYAILIFIFISVIRIRRKLDC